MIVYAHTDGASRGNPGESGIGILLRDEHGVELFAGCGYIGTATNNVAEYEALLACLQKAVSLQCEKLVVHSDSELMVRQVQGKYKVKNKSLQRYFQKVQKMLSSAPFDFSIVHVMREENRDADLLANTGIDSKQPLTI